MFFFFKQKTAYEMRISDWSSDVCSSDLGTNAGLKRVSAGTEAASYTELLHVRRRFIHKEALRSATALVTNAVLATRDQRIWGEAGTACASDSTKVGAWDQNLMAEWHVRYRGRGVMIYRSEERRVGQGWVSTCRSRWGPDS